MPNPINTPEPPESRKISATGEQSVAVGRDAGTIITGNVTNNVTGRVTPIAWVTLVAALLLLAAGTFPAWKSAIEKGSKDVRTIQPDLLRTPHAGLEFWQNKARASMSLANKSDLPIIDVPLKREPFILRFPKIDEQGLRVNAWTSDYNFSIEDSDRATLPPFCSGCAYAAHAYFNGKLFLGKHGFNYFLGKRVSSYSNEQDEIYVSGVSSKEGHVDFPDAQSRLYLTFWIDHDGDDVFNIDEFEFVRLNFAD
ncbi:hypothetical protein [Streptomyces sp. DSM 40750]|uniref:hypothetical protein n=1 Tax=Streptomyces sp. DSM 40750 TaxID=2801030 RepID=UPI00214C6A0D|nr:hypothetical protein [Streptomyces sp. DSM 40750]UUU24913.1 hypothetical protein JIX55_34270 [Streptomyces sp. DSM 40750]